jgi:biopolymer transport protein ExbD
MRFRRRRAEEPEINLIPFIDVLLVIIIFLMLSTTYSKYSELQITLPSAPERMRGRPIEITVSSPPKAARRSKTRRRPQCRLRRSNWWRLTPTWWSRRG